MRYLTLLLVLVFGIGACGAGVVGNGNVTSTSRPLSGFSRVDAEGAGVTTVVEGTSYVVTITTDTNIQPLVDTRVEGDTLIVDEHDVQRATDLRIDIQMPTFGGGTLAGSGELDVSVASLHDVDLALTGSGDVAFSGDAMALSASLSGAGTLVLTGNAESLSALLSGSGDLQARDLPVNQATLDSSGSGELQATALQSITLKLGGSGDIDWWGAATVMNTSSSGSGHITHH